MDIIKALEKVTVSIKAWADTRFDSINRQLDLLYQPIKISTFSNSVSTMEIGDELKSISLTWTLTKDPVSQEIVYKKNDTETVRKTVDVNTKKYSANDLSVTYNDYATHKFTLTVTDERNITVFNDAFINFTNRTYYGAISSDAVIDSDAIRGLAGSTLSNPRNFSFSATANDGEHIVYALPSGGRDPVFTANNAGLPGGFFKMEEPVEVTGQHGYIEDYDIWLSENVGLGTIPVKVT